MRCESFLQIVRATYPNERCYLCYSLITCTKIESNNHYPAKTEIPYYNEMSLNDEIWLKFTSLQYCIAWPTDKVLSKARFCGDCK